MTKFRVSICVWKVTNPGTWEQEDDLEIEELVGEYDAFWQAKAHVTRLMRVLAALGLVRNK